MRTCSSIILFGARRVAIKYWIEVEEFFDICDVYVCLVLLNILIM